jgi:hypothetical protein
MNPYVPSFFGSWEELSKMYNPFFASTTQYPMFNFLQQQRPFFQPELFTQDFFQYFRPPLNHELNQQLFPPERMTHLFIKQLSVRDLTQRLPKEQGAEITARIDQTIADEIDFVCGTGPRPHPFPLSPVAFAVAAELNLFAHTLQEGTLKTSILQLTERITTRATTGVTLKKEARAA